MNECHQKRDHLKRKGHLPTINFFEIDRPWKIIHTKRPPPPQKKKKNYRITGCPGSPGTPETQNFSQPPCESPWRFPIIASGLVEGCWRMVEKTGIVSLKYYDEILKIEWNWEYIEGIWRKDHDVLIKSCKSICNKRKRLYNMWTYGWWKNPRRIRRFWTQAKHQQRIRATFRHHMSVFICFRHFWVGF